MPKSQFYSSLDLMGGAGVSVEQGKFKWHVGKEVRFLDACHLTVFFDDGDVVTQQEVYLNDLQVRDLIAMLQEYQNAG